MQIKINQKPIIVPDNAMLTYDQIVEMAGMTGVPQVIWLTPKNVGARLVRGQTRVAVEGTEFLVIA